MAQVKDPVCGMIIDSDTAAARSSHRGQTYYFCSTECLRQFEADPEKYARESGGEAEVPVRPKPELERHEPRFTKSGGMVAPKFGAAGSGGAEYERLPEAHDDREAK
jgi:YHS domain-containing protein